MTCGSVRQISFAGPFKRRPERGWPTLVRPASCDLPDALRAGVIRSDFAEAGPDSFRLSGYLRWEFSVVDRFRPLAVMEPGQVRGVP